MTPQWPTTPEPVDPDGASYLVLAIGAHPDTARVARSWVESAEAMAPTTLGVLDRLDDPVDRAALRELVGRTRTGVRVMVVGGEYDVLQALAEARAAGLLPVELRSFVSDRADLPVYCAHCRATHRIATRPGAEVDCPGCGRRLEVHEHLSAHRGDFLASDARARELA